MAQHQGSLSTERIRQNIQSRFNPIRGLDLTRLSTILDNYHRGYLREAALLWDAIERRDFQCQAVIPKRKRAASLLDWQVLVVDDSAEATAQKEALEYFYNNLTATHALRLNQNGGFATLAAQMMDAVGKGFAAHEIIWEPKRHEGKYAMSAKFIFTPLWFFECKTGSLRFLETDYDQDGIDLDPGGWMVTTAENPLMEATSVAYGFKALTLKDWLIYSERFGMPLTHGKTSAAVDSPEWNAFGDALQQLGTDWSILTNAEATLEFHNAGGTGARPQQPLVEYMDDAITVLWRGGDLSTKSSDATGATQQEEERENIEIADALLLSETLNNQVDRQVIRILFGEDTPVKAYLKVTPKTRADMQKDLSIWQAGVESGVSISVEDFREHFSLPSPAESKDGEVVELLQKTTPAPGQGFANGKIEELLNTASQHDLAELANLVAANEQIDLNNLPTERTSKALQLYLTLKHGGMI